MLNARYQLLPFSERPPLPFAPPPEGWAPQTAQFMSGMAVADLVNAVVSLWVVVGFFRGKPWVPWLGMVALTVAAYAAFAFTWGTTAVGAPTSGISYLWVNLPTLPVLVLFCAWCYWVRDARFAAV